MNHNIPAPFGYPTELGEEPTTRLDTRQLYEFHVTRAERAKEQCDLIIAHHERKARWEVQRGQTQLPYDVTTLADRYVANDLVFAQWSGRYRFHESRATYLGQRILLSQQDAIIKLLQDRNKL